jgi:threonine dehydratase
MIQIQDIKDAHTRIKPYIHHTPVLQSSLLNQWLGHELFFKAECLQKIGAFKARGALNTVSWLKENNIPVDHIVAQSSGNHAQAVAWAAKQFQIPATIFMPSYASKIKMQASRSYGAEVKLFDTRDEVDAQVKKAAETKGTYWIHPFNHEQVMSGQGTAALEALYDHKGIDAICAPCGGGGLLSGTYVAAKALAPNIKVIGGEPANANDAAMSIRAKSIQKLNGIPDTIADGVMTPALGNLTFEYILKLDEMIEVTEYAIKYWTQWLNHLLKIRVEPTSAVAMAAIHQWLQGQSQPKRVMVILSGGNVDQETEMKIWNTNFLDIVPVDFS